MTNCRPEHSIGCVNSSWRASSFDVRQGYEDAVPNMIAFELRADEQSDES